MQSIGRSASVQPHPWWPTRARCCATTSRMAFVRSTTCNPRPTDGRAVKPESASWANRQARNGSSITNVRWTWSHSKLDKTVPRPSRFAQSLPTMAEWYRHHQQWLEGHCNWCFERVSECFVARLDLSPVEATCILTSCHNSSIVREIE